MSENYIFPALYDSGESIYTSGCLYLSFFFFSWKYLPTAVELQQHEMASSNVHKSFVKSQNVTIGSSRGLPQSQLSSFSGVNLEVAKRQNEPTLPERIQRGTLTFQGLV